MSCWSAGLSAGAHVLPGTTLLLGGVRGGLLLRRVLAALGATDPGADGLDQAGLAVGELPPGLEVSGAGPTGDDVVLRMRDDVTPAAVWAAATRYTGGETALIATIDAVVGPHRRAVACGGWTRMASVRAAKRRPSRICSSPRSSPASSALPCSPGRPPDRLRASPSESTTPSTISGGDS